MKHYNKYYKAKTFNGKEVNGQLVWLPTNVTYGFLGLKSRSDYTNMKAFIIKGFNPYSYKLSTVEVQPKTIEEIITKQIS